MCKTLWNGPAGGERHARLYKDRQIRNDPRSPFCRRVPPRARRAAKAHGVGPSWRFASWSCASRPRAMLTWKPGKGLARHASAAVWNRADGDQSAGMPAITLVMRPLYAIGGHAGIGSYGETLVGWDEPIRHTAS